MVPVGVRVGRYRVNTVHPEGARERVRLPEPYVEPLVRDLGTQCDEHVVTPGNGPLGPELDGEVAVGDVDARTGVDIIVRPVQLQRVPEVREGCVVGGGNRDGDRVGVAERTSGAGVPLVVGMYLQGGGTVEIGCRREGKAVEGGVDLRDRPGEGHYCVGYPITSSETEARGP